jgi:hypothetical protein
MVFCAHVVLHGGALVVPLLHFLAVHFVLSRCGSLYVLIQNFALSDFRRWFLYKLGPRFEVPGPQAIPL